MTYGSKLVLLAMLCGLTAGASAEPLSFLTEQQKLASYCAGVSESRLRELRDFIKSQCASSSRRECITASEDLSKAENMDDRLWKYLKADVYAYKSSGERQKLLSQEAMGKGGEDWLACKRRLRGQAPEDLPACRQVQSCLNPQGLTFLPP
jgi:hypothetical protein